jgi:ABC-type microcin C transport system duplicated ATPase subunit YejF
MLEGIDLEVRSGEILALLDWSGSGKASSESPETSPAVQVASADRGFT